VVADRGYFKIEDIEACEKVGIEPYVPRPSVVPRSRRALFRKDEFQYDPASDSYVCPAGRRLHPYSSSLLRGLKKINYVNKLACDDCAIRARCTGASFARYRVSRTKRYWTGCRPDWRNARMSSTADARRSNIRSALLNNG